jgi:isopenicillin N synthase-like dioxygenase
LEMVASPIELEITEATTTTTISNPAITMEDVVAFASIEIQKKEQHQKQQHHLHAQDKTPFEWFEEHDRTRVMVSEKVGLDRLRNDDDETTEQQERSGGGEWGGSIDPSEIVSWNDLKALMGEGMAAAAATGSSSTNHEDRVGNRARELYRTIEKSGGFLVVELDEKDASTVADMWSTMEAYFSLPPDKQQVGRQTLEKENGTHDPEAGYHFRQTYMNIDGVVLPETIQDALRNNNNIMNNNDDSNHRGQNENDGSCDDTYRRGIEDSFQLFAEMTKTVGTIVAAGALEKDLLLTDKIVSSMLEDRNGHPFVNADHRLSRYILGRTDNNGDSEQQPPDEKQKTAKAKESLISHTDWTFTTCIPLSAIPGLQVWKPRSEEWIVPETILGGGGKDDRTKYVVVMTGKWIELLTNRKLTSCVHRVVTNTTKPKPRLSAPFFCRVKRPIFDLVQDEFQISWSDPSPFGSSQEEAIDSMGQMFGNWIRFLEGDRDPTIPGCVLDMCLDREDKAPECYSIEEILGE